MLSVAELLCARELASSVGMVLFVQFELGQAQSIACTERALSLSHQVWCRMSGDWFSGLFGMLLRDKPDILPVQSAHSDFHT